MTQDANSQINTVMNRLRAQLFNTIEQMGFDETQCNAYKQTVKDITSAAWNNVTSIVEKLEGKIKE
jgi:hypothetical protein